MNPTVNQKENRVELFTGMVQIVACLTFRQFALIGNLRYGFIAQSLGTRVPFKQEKFFLIHREHS
jgi:hypothetical protein